MLVGPQGPVTVSPVVWHAIPTDVPSEMHVMTAYPVPGPVRSFRHEPVPVTVPLLALVAAANASARAVHATTAPRKIFRRRGRVEQPAFSGCRASMWPTSLR